MKVKQIKNVYQSEHLFAMTEKPVMVQLTIHFSNWLQSGNKALKIKRLRRYIAGNYKYSSHHWDNLVNYYGIETIEAFFTTVYGWDINELKGAA